MIINQVNPFISTVCKTFATLSKEASEKRLDLKNVIITGGAAGIGFEIANNYLNKGVSKLAILDVNPARGQMATAKLRSKYGGKVDFYEADVTNKDDLNATFKKINGKWGHTDVLVNNAGVIKDSQPEKVLSTNLTAVVRWTLKYWNHMRKDKGGKGGTIVNIASIHSFELQPYTPIYTGTKHGVLGFTRSLGHEFHYSRTGVRVIALCPGYTRTLQTNFPSGMCFDEPQLVKDYHNHLQNAAFQDAAAVGRAAAELFEKAASGTAWCVMSSKPIFEI